MKTLSISLQETLYDQLKHSVPSKKISKFVSLAITKALEKDEQILIEDYTKAEQDEERQKLLTEWDAIVDDFDPK
ncbi:hypothetical protein [Rickettsia endosymbiont of Orchestes rusci]|uniref:hypothetical protein n=1 Tax=Rickettsia endosymbiont of Orchestes rusci TaxID=3066250 RepID=UPI00313E112A